MFQNKEGQWIAQWAVKPKAQGLNLSVETTVVYSRVLKIETSPATDGVKMTLKTLLILYVFLFQYNLYKIPLP